MLQAERVCSHIGAGCCCHQAVLMYNREGVVLSQSGSALCMTIAPWVRGHVGVHPPPARRGTGVVLGAKGPQT